MVDTVDIKTGYSCNNDCYHCVIADKRRELIKNGRKVDRSTEEVIQHIKEAAMEGAESIVLTGGEITIRGDFFQMVEYALSKGLTVIIQTNGRMFYYEEFAKRIASYDKVHLTVALHSSKPEVHDRITGSKNSFKQTTEGIRNLKKHGIGNRVGGKIVMSKMNYKDLPELITLAHNLGLMSVNIAFPHAMGNAQLNFYDCVPKYSEIKNYILKTIRKSLELKMYIDFEAMPLCFLPGYETFASEFRLSEHTELRDLTHIDPNYTKTRKTKAKVKDPKCTRCKLYLLCEGCWDDYAEGYDTTELTPLPGQYIRDPRMLESFKIHPVPIYKKNINTVTSEKTPSQLK